MFLLQRNIYVFFFISFFFKQIKKYQQKTIAKTVDQSDDKRKLDCSCVLIILGNSLNYYAYYEATGGTSNSENSIFIYLSPTSSSIGCLQFSYHMHGADMGSLLVNVSSGSYSELLWSRSGNVGNKWKMASVSFNKFLSRYEPNYGNILFKFVAVRGNGYRSDIALDDISISFGSNCSSGESFSFCNFEVDTCGFTGSNWNRASGSTTSIFTGPSVDASGRSDGYFYRLNASAPFAIQFASVLVSNPFKYSTGCLKFAYHIVGTNYEKLAVGLISRYNQTTVWEKISQGNLWKRATIPLQEILNPIIPSFFFLTFMATKGRNNLTNIAIDEVEISYGSYCTTSSTTTTTTTSTTTTPFITHHATASTTRTTSTTTTSTNMTPGTISLCNFEENTCGFVLSENWFRNRGSTHSSTTGPNVDASGSPSKYYIYYEATSGIANSNNAIFILLSNCYLSTTGCLQFSYHMYGANMGSLLVLLSNRYLRQTIWSRHGDKGNQWHTASVPLNQFLSNSSLSILNIVTMNTKKQQHGSRISNPHHNLQLTFVAVRGYGFESDIALDDISVSFGSDCISGKNTREKMYILLQFLRYRQTLYLKYFMMPILSPRIGACNKRNSFILSVISEELLETVNRMLKLALELKCPTFNKLIVNMRTKLKIYSILKDRNRKKIQYIWVVEQETP
ncbi:MAM and LDL-receptor class A domain-containing protein 1-like [Hydractinia symbiolongicarpus]|uniref:MAM and LDL-receptor class A domain-containing protein 1-like n=1 Tax=Hydractinia symbiolongicarpus TaxID=13093 RepID=UPI0025506DA9|nr:MAM and LDL-receptor class A domain-containing protein 1-like [Hydractinia symbiolongicarpus]